jgi:hypothetical protein
MSENNPLTDLVGLSQLGTYTEELIERIKAVPHYISQSSGTAAVTTSPYCYAKWDATDKTITELYDGLTIAYKIPVAGNSKGVCLNLNSTGYHPVVYNVSSTISTRYSVNSVIILIYDSTVSASVYENSATTSTIEGVWRCVNDYDSGNTVSTAYCSTSASTAAKVATCTNYALLSKSYIHVIFTASNTSKNKLTLNINSKGAKTIYINGVVSSSTNYTLPAGSYIAYYDGTNYYFRTDGKLTGDITGDADTLDGKHASDFADGIEYNESTSELNLKSGDSVLATVAISANGGISSELPSKTVFNNDGSIVQTYSDGSSVKTIFNSDGSIQEISLSASGESTTSTTVFNSDGSIDKKIE